MSRAVVIVSMERIDVDVTIDRSGSINVGNGCRVGMYVQIENAWRRDGGSRVQDEMLIGSLSKR
jgi:hypothetical protein